jgi:hypothetical protein
MIDVDRNAERLALTAGVPSADRRYRPPRRPGGRCGYQPEYQHGHSEYLGDLAGLSEHHLPVYPHLRGVGRSNAADIGEVA